MNSIILEGKGISKSFGTDKNRNTVLKGIDIQILKNDFTVIMGSSGAGKSTLLYTLSGMDRLTEGEIYYRGQKVNTLEEKKQADLRAKEYGFVFQQTNLVTNLSLYENVTVAGFLAGKEKESEVEKHAQELFKQLGIDHVKDHTVSQVSGGEAQRAAIARAVIGNPGIVFADEPTGALNRAGSEAVLDVFTNLHTLGQCMLMVTHDIRAAVRGSRIIYLEDGKIAGELMLGEYKKEVENERYEKLSNWLASLKW